MREADSETERVSSHALAMPTENKALLGSARPIGRMLSIVLALVASLLTLPAGIVAMTAFWLIAYTTTVLPARSSTWLLIAPVAVILVKRVDWPIGLWVLMAIAMAVIAASISKRKLFERRRRLLPALVWLAWLAFAFDSYLAVQANHAVSPLDARPIVCIGDSLTSYTKRGGYPEVLAELLSVPVINLGQPGVTSSEALAKLPEMIAARPQAVVIEQGGHDFLKDATLMKTASRAAARRNLEQFIAAAKKANAEVILIEVPRGFISDPYAGLERQLAREHDLELLSYTTIRQLVHSSPAAPPGVWLGGPYLSDDGLHPNARGNALLARRVLNSLARL